MAFGKILLLSCACCVFLDAYRVRLARKDVATAPGDYVRVVVSGDDLGASVVESSVNLRVEKCGYEAPSSSLPYRFAYRNPVNLQFIQSGGRWITQINDVQYYMKKLAAVKVSAAALDGARRFWDDSTPELDNGYYTKSHGWWIFGSSSSQAIGKLNAQNLALKFSTEQNLTEPLNEGESMRFIVDLKPVGGAALHCPPLGATGHHAYGPDDNFKLMVFARGAACDDMAEVSPPGTEHYCLDSKGTTQRAWMVAIDLNQAKPVVRNPADESGNGRAINNLPEIARRRDAAKPRHRQLIPQYVDPKGPIGDALCRYVAYSPEQYLENEPTQLRDRAKVVMNANFFLFVDVQDLPCATPLGPVVSDGKQVQTYRGSVRDMEVARWPQAFEHLKASHVLVMYTNVDQNVSKKSVAFILRANEFDAWFESLSESEKLSVNAITGHKILKDGKPVNQYREFARTGNSAFWEGKNARSVIGIQYDDKCALPGRPDLEIKCGSMMVLLQFERMSQGQTVMTFFANSTMDPRDRPLSAGVTLPEVQDILQFMMIDEALNFDGSGSSSLWTSIGDLDEKRSQPSDVVAGNRYQFRPSPTLLAFEDMPR